MSKTTPIRALTAGMLACALSACGQNPDAQIAEAEKPSDAVIEAEGSAEGQAAVAARRDADLGRSGEIEQVTWDYGTCTDAASLIPPPMEDWGLFNDTPLGEWPITETNASITYHYYDKSFEPNSPEYQASAQNASIYITSGTVVVDSLKQMFTDPNLRDAMFQPGPYNYPVDRLGTSTLLGDYRVLVDGNGEGAQQYLTMIIKCAIDNGLIAEGVDPASLRDTP